MWDSIVVGGENDDFGVFGGWGNWFEFVEEDDCGGVGEEWGDIGEVEGNIGVFGLE